MTLQKSKLVEAQNLFHNLIDNQNIQLLSILGIGAYGVVYLGQDVYTQRYYGVKLLTNSSLGNNEEANIHARLSGHPNILKFEKLLTENNRTFLIFEYASGGDLFTAITKHKMNIVGNNEAIRHIFIQIIDAVQYCHENNIFHRDLKPENILLGPHLQVKLADFGLATTDIISQEFGCGSTFYFSPECQEGVNEKYSHSKPSHLRKLQGYNTQKNDIWSLGVILINLTAGRNPWKQATLKNHTFAAYVHSPSHFFRKILPSISDELEKILLLIFNLDPTKRISLSELRLQVLKCQSFVQQRSNNTFICKHKQNLHVSNHHHRHHNQLQIQNIRRMNYNLAPYHQYRKYCKTERKRRYSSPVFRTIL